MGPRAGAVHLGWALLALAFTLFTPGAHAALGILYQVTNVNDSGPGSLRQVIHDANSDGQESGIRFAIPAEQGRVIAPFTDLPPLLELTRITGPTNASGEPIIELSGAADFAFGEVGLRLQVAGCTVRGLKITGWPTAGIDITGGGATVSNCWIGSADSPNAVGIRISSNSNIIGGLQGFERNLISGNSVAGIEVLTSLGNVIRGNRIGTDLAGMAALPNGNGIVLAGRSVIGGLEPGAGNLISGNLEAGIRLVGAVDTEVYGNIVGLAIDGATPLPNDTGILIDDSETCFIGSGGPEGRNVISGNTTWGINMPTSGAVDNQVSGNHIGTDVTGTVAAGNGTGVRIFGGGGNSVGGSGRNLISGNGLGVWIYAGLGNGIVSNWIGTDVTGLAPLANGEGIRLTDSHSTTVAGNVIAASDGFRGDGIHIDDFDDRPELAEHVITGNFIGTDATGLAPMGNFGHGISLGHFEGAAANPSNSRIGGLSPADANVIAANGGSGIEINQSGVLIQGNRIGVAADGLTPMGNGGDGVRVLAGEGVNILSNRIANNSGLGIDLGGDGPTQNDPPTDDDTGINLLQNFPVLGSAHLDEVPPRVTGLLTSAPNAVFTIEIFLSEVADPSGHGEGLHPLISIPVQTSETGLATFNETVSDPLPSGRFVTATATDSAGNSSEFSPFIIANGPGPLLVEIVEALLGRGAALPEHDVNGDGRLDVADVVDFVIQ